VNPDSSPSVLWAVGARCFLVEVKRLKLKLFIVLLAVRMLHQLIQTFIDEYGASTAVPSDCIGGVTGGCDWGSLLRARCAGH